MAACWHVLLWAQDCLLGTLRHPHAALHEAKAHAGRGQAFPPALLSLPHWCSPGHRSGRAPFLEIPETPFASASSSDRLRKSGAPDGAGWGEEFWELRDLSLAAVFAQVGSSAGVGSAGRERHCRLARRRWHSASAIFPAQPSSCSWWMPSLCAGIMHACVRVQPAPL